MDSSDDEYLASATVLKYFINKKLFGKHPINDKRSEFGEFHHLYSDLRKYPAKFKEYTRMSIETFDYILEKIGDKLKKKWSNFIKVPICPCERLIVTLRFLATGASFASLAFSFRLGKSTVGAIVKETTQVLWDNMFTIHMPQPNEQCFQEIAEQYWKLWNFPNCIGAIDGKHIRIKCPGNTGSMYYNYKHFFSIVLQGIADANCKFIAVEVGGYGKQSDGGTFSSSKIFNLLKSGELPVPGNTCLPNSEEIVPYVFLGDEAYPLLECLLRPYSRKEITEDHEYFNARLSRARKCIECAFGLLSARFRILWKPIETDPLFAELLVKCICLLHNIIIDLEGLDENLKEEVQKENLEKIIKEFNKTSVKNGRLIRDKFCNFVCMNKI
ncbi:uncharacterized protein LOC128923103 [Zeugodacus cucurbitae]|uniref:uncharacterized protein LOC128923103 n=1 Tax=Zeugodacus cucurbitae TaxID=28588 RepID=UPI0023D965D3|nr:uncharacterized protein LOC128923103 [Zeugodacus cucurbitae]